MHKRERLAQRASPAIATLMSPISTTKQQGFYVRYEPSPWGRSSKRKGISSLFHFQCHGHAISHITPLAISKTMKGP